MNKNGIQPANDLCAAAGARLAEAALAAATQVPLARLRATTRGRKRAALARQTAMYIAHVAFGLSLTRVGVSFGRDRATVRHACALIEDRRDDPRIDLGLAALERGLRALTARLEARAWEAHR